LEKFFIIYYKKEACDGILFPKKFISKFIHAPQVTMTKGYINKLLIILNILIAQTLCNLV